MNTSSTSTSRASTSRNSRSSKKAARATTITIAAGTTIQCAVADIANHPESGVVVIIEGNPNGFIPNRLLAGKNNSAKAEHRNLLIATPGMTLEVFVEEAGMAAPKGEEKPGQSRAPRPRIILNEDKIVHSKIIGAKQQANARLREQVAALQVGDCMHATVVRFASKKNDDGEGTHLIGAFVELENGLPALLHKSQMISFQAIEEGAAIYVAINSAAMDGNRAKVSVKELKAPAASSAVSTGHQAAPAPATQDTPPSGRSASQAMWDQVAAFLNEPGTGPVVVIDPSV
ncbi:MAG: hypothetical protein WC714_15215 [Candidatus Obscuribacterales bacterium]